MSDPSQQRPDDPQQPEDNRRPEERKLDALNALDPAVDRSQQNAAIKKFLADKHFRVVAKAATLAAERSLHERTTDLITAYGRFLCDPVKRDPKCIAKQAIARALVELGCHDVGFFLEGIRYKQLEPVWGGTQDTAIDVRCSCAMGLVSTGYFRAIQELTVMLNDTEWRARAGAARAISCGSPREAESLLRFKVLVGDAEAEVVGECFSGILAIAPEEGMPFVAGYLAGDNEGVRDFAALALGESRQPRALEYLRDTCKYTVGDFRTVLIRAAALHRSEAAFDWLISIIAEGSRTDCDVAIEALSVYERNTKLAERVKAALAQREDHA